MNALPNNNPNPREILANRFPNWTQGLITYQTGVPLPGQKLTRRTPLGRALQSFALFFGGLGAGIAAAHAGHLSGLVAAWTVTVAGVRELSLVVVHHASHGTLGPWSGFLGRAAATLSIEMNFTEYQARHRLHHRRSITSSHEDDTTRFLVSIGITPGLSVAENRRRFFRALISPSLLWRQLRSRVKSQLRGDRATRAAYFLYLAALVALAGVTGLWTEIALAWAVPILFLSYPAKASMLVVEHFWPPAGLVGREVVTDFNTRCLPLPPEAWTPVSSIRYGGEILLNLFLRFTAIVGDLPNHPLHHAAPLSDNWANHIPASLEWAADRQARGLPPISEAWGYLQALDMALSSFEKASHESLKERGRGGKVSE